MRERLCGVCNEEVPIDHEQITRFEENGTVTPYHMGCAKQAYKLIPCDDCGEHRLFCPDCAEFDN